MDKRPSLGVWVKVHGCAGEHTCYVLVNNGWTLRRAAKEVAKELELEAGQSVHWVSRFSGFSTLLLVVRKFHEGFTHFLLQRFN